MKIQASHTDENNDFSTCLPVLEAITVRKPGLIIFSSETFKTQRNCLIVINLGEHKYRKQFNVLDHDPFAKVLSGNS